MDNKQNDFFTVAIIAGILLAFSALDLLTGIGVLHWESATPSLPRPPYAAGSMLDGTFFEAYEKHANDNFYNKTKWTKTVRDVEYFLGKREYNGIYLGKGETYFERHLAEDYGETAVEESISFLRGLAEKYDADVMLVPTADVIWRGRLPLYADVFDQKNYLDKVKAQVGTKGWIDAYEAMLSHGDEPVYYETDPHWTSLGAYYGYLTWWKHTGERLQYYYDPAGMETVTEDFVGPLVRRSGAEEKKEQISVFAETLGKHVQVTYDDQVMLEDYYRPEYLQTDNGYGYFLGEGFGYVRIDLPYRQTKTLFVIGDSYANAMIPLVAPYYKTIYFVDLKNYQGDLERLLETYGSSEKCDVLVLSGVTGYLDLFR